MIYKVVQRIAVSYLPAERLAFNTVSNRVNSFVLISTRQLVTPYDIGVQKRMICISEKNHAENIKQTEEVSKSYGFSEEYDDYSKKAKEGNDKEEKETNEDDEDEQIRESILSASLKFVPGYGWTKHAVEAGTESLGYPTVTAGVISDPDISLIHYHYRVSNEKLIKLMKKEMEEQKASGQEVKVTKFLKKSIEQRLIMNVPYMSRWAEALAIMTYPQNAPNSLTLGLELVDSMWHVGGDTNVDMSWYSKRLILLGIYKTTELAMMQDQSDGYLDTWAFLDRRFDDSKNLQELLGTSDDALKILGAVGSTVQAFLGVKR